MKMPHIPEIAQNLKGIREHPFGLATRPWRYLSPPKRLRNLDNIPEHPFDLVIQLS
jgi:hypothetical protein